MVQTMPMRGDYVLSFEVQGRPPSKPGEYPSANHRVISSDYFRALGIPLLRGRTFTNRDAEKGPKVAVVDDAFVRRYFPDEDPIGRASTSATAPTAIIRSSAWWERALRQSRLQGDADDVRAVPAGRIFVDVGDHRDGWRTGAAVVGSAADRTRHRCGLPVFSMTPLADVVTTRWRSSGSRCCC